MNNRWIVLAAGIIMQVILGGIYAWSTFSTYLIDDYSFTKGECGFIFGLTIGVFTLAMTFAGRLLTKKGPRLTASIGSLLFFAGYLLSSYSYGSFIMILLSLGLVAGAGIGFGYVCPLSVGMKWFPRNKGLVTGVAVAGFGGGAVLLSSVASSFLEAGMDVMQFFRYYSIVSGIILLGASMFLSEPENGEEEKIISNGKSSIINLPFGINTLGMFAGTFAGLLIIGNLSPLAIKAGLSQKQAVFMISIFAIGNAIGRVTWGQLFDKLGYKSIPLSLGSFAVFCTIFLLPLPEMFLFVSVALMGFGFGANFVVYASSISGYFGVDAFAKLYPICFLAYGVAGIIGPGTGGYIADTTGSYNMALYISIAIVTVATILTSLGLKTLRKQEA